jgi:uncharacterized tellurite resistance protein B-like protein
MRPYPTDSPQAAARVLALALIADGHLQPAELRALERSRAHERLRMTKAELNDVLYAMCDDLIAEARTRDHGHHSEEDDDACVIDPETLARLFAEVRDASLRRTVLRLAMQTIRADRQLHEGEMRILLAAVDHWGLRPEGLEQLLLPPHPATSGPRSRVMPRSGAMAAAP